MLLIREQTDEGGIIEWRQIYEIEPKYRNFDDLVASGVFYVITTVLYSNIPWETTGTVGNYSRQAMIEEIRNKTLYRADKRAEHTTLLEDDPLCF